MATVLPVSSLGPPGPCSRFSWVITSARCVNFGEYKKRSEAFSTTSTPHKSAGDSGQPQERPPPRPAPSGKVTGSRPLDVGRGPDPRADSPASRSSRALSRTEPHEVEPGQPSSLAFGPAPSAAAPRTYRWSPISP